MKKLIALVLAAAVFAPTLAFAGASTDAALTNRDTVWTRATEDTGGLRQNVVQATRLEGRMQSVANSLLSQYVLKMVRKKDGAVKGFKGKTAQGAQVLFTRWVR